MISVLLFPLHLTGLKILRSVLTPLFEVQQISLFDFIIAYPGKLIFQIHKSSAILIESFCGSKCDVQRRKINFFRVDYWSIYCIFLSWNKRFSFRPLFFNIMMFSVPTLSLTQKAIKLCSEAGSQARE
jgi:hypothetical protein